MDGIGNEVTQKIRAAIKSKLVELSAYVDDELPDYIMVMIANKKTREQMSQDLSLFLGDSTESFTTWLQQVLNQLQSITSEAKQKPQTQGATSFGPEQQRPVPPPEMTAATSKPAFSANTPVPTPAEPRGEPDDEVLALKADTEADDDFGEDLRNAEQHVPKRSSIPLVRPFPRIVAPESEPSRSRAAPSRASTSKRAGAPTSTVGAVVRRKPQFISDDEEEEYDPSNPSVGSVASVVKVSERRSSVPESLQANKLLVIKAMKDAHASVINAKRNPSARVEPYEPTPIGKQPTTRKKRPAERCGPEKSSEAPVPPKRPAVHPIRDRLQEPPAVTVPAVEREQPANVAVVKSVGAVEESIEDDSDLLEIGVEGEDVHAVVKDTLPSTPAVTRSVTESSVSGAESPRKEENWPHFVVTLNGVDPSNFKLSSREVLSSDAQDFEELPEDVLEEEQLLEQEGLAPEEGVPMQIAEGEVAVEEEAVVGKMKEKCRYWPACKNGDQCPFQHPTVPCKAFPNCKYKEKCLFIHPNCKYDAFCKRRDCPYTHASRRNFSCAPPVASSPSLKHCRFYPHCTNTQCPYFHPKPCKFGASCQARSCPFSHESNVPPPDKLKWTAATCKPAASSAT